MRAEVSTTAVEFRVSQGEALLLALSVILVAALVIAAGWQVAFVALGLSLLGAAAVDAIQRADTSPR